MKSLKNLLVPFIILIALVICAVVYFAVENIKGREPSETTSGMIDVVHYSTADIASVSVKNNSTGYTSVVSCTKNGSDIVYAYQGDEFSSSEKYSQQKMGNYVALLSSFSCNSKVSSEGNFAEYGLDKPRFKITINGIDGKNTVIYIGNDSPDPQFSYMYLDGSKDIYTITSTKAVISENTAVNFLDSVMVGLDFSEITSVHFDRKSDKLSVDANVTMGSNGIASFTFVSPYNHPASNYFGHMMDTIAKLEISEFVNISLSELASYGLSDPAYHFTFDKKDGTKTELDLSKLINGYYYGRLSGINKYFMISEQLIDGLDLQETTLLDPYICYCYAKDYTSITGTYNGKTFKFELDVPDGKSIMATESTVKLDGRNAKIEDSFGRSYCSLLFESIACIKIGGVEMDAKVNKSSAAELTLSFIDRNYETTVYEFYKRDSDSYYVFKNGEYMSFYVYSREIFNNGGTDTYNYGYWKAFELLNDAISGNSNGIYDISKDL